jgi:hypothetical protein
MLQRICLILLVCALALFLGGGLSQAGWSDLGLTNARDASSLIISVKKHKHHDDDEDDDNGLEQCGLRLTAEAKVRENEEWQEMLWLRGGEAR